MHKGKNRLLVDKWSISGWRQQDTNQPWFSLTNERRSGSYRNTSYLGWWLPRRSDNWADPGEWGYLPYMDLLLYFLDQKVLSRITKSLFWLTYQSSRVSPTVHLHHLPLELWYMLWGEHGDMLSWPPFKDSLSSCWKCSVGKLKSPAPPGAVYVHSPSRGRYDSLANGRVKTTLESPHHSRPPCGQLRSSGQCYSVLSRFIPPDSTMLTPRAPLIYTPSLNSIWVCILENQPACIRKHSSIWGGFLFENYWLHTDL